MFLSIYIGFFIACNPSKKTNTSAQTQQHKDTVTNTNLQQDTAIESFEKGEQLLAMNFLFPFDFENSIETDAAEGTDIKAATEWNERNANAIGFYQGFQLAANENTSSKIKLSSRAVDTAQDSLLLSANLLLDETYNASYLFSQLNQVQLNQLQKQNKLHHKWIVCINPIQQDCEQCIQLLPNNALLIKLASQYVFKNFSDRKITCIYRPSSVKEKNLAFSFINQLRGQADSSTVVPFEYSVTKDSLVLNSVKGKRLIIIASNDESYVSGIFNWLKYYADGDNLTVFGMPTWENFESIDFSQFVKFNTTIFNSHYVNYNSKEFTEFKKVYTNRYNTAPAQAAYLAYFFTKGLIDIGESGKKVESGFGEDVASRFNRELFNFKKAGTNGYTNHKVHVLKFKDYKLVPVE